MIVYERGPEVWQSTGMTTAMLALFACLLSMLMTVCATHLFDLI